jgi:hypothetical protein
MSARPLFVSLAFACFCLVCPDRAAAHRLDEYLQATRLSVEHGRIELEIDLTPGVDVASEIFALMDTNHDGQLSAEESEAYVRQVLSSIMLNVDGRPVPVTLIDSRFPEFSDMAEGVGTIRLRASGAFPVTGAGRHQLYYRNAHQSKVGVYLVNALVPADKQIEIVEQRRDYLQHELTVDYRINPQWSSGSSWWLIVGVVMAGVLTVTRWSTISPARRRQQLIW